MTTIVISCGKRKIWHDDPTAPPTLARYAYTGAFYKKLRAYAETFYSANFYILSAKHGFISADFLIEENYDASFSVRGSGAITTNQLIARKQISDDTIILLAGKNYFKQAKAYCDFYGIELQAPLLGFKGMGYMTQAITNALKTNEPL